MGRSVAKFLNVCLAVRRVCFIVQHHMASKRTANRRLADNPVARILGADFVLFSSRLYPRHPTMLASISHVRNQTAPGRM